MTFKELTDKIAAAFSNPLLAVTVILVLFALFYYTISVLQRNNAKWLVFVFAAYVLATGVAFASIDTGDSSNGILYLFVPAVFILAVTVLFATEIKRDVWETFAKKTVEIRHVDKGSSSKKDVDACIEEIIKALQNMSKNDVGAIMILANGNLPRTVIESGVIVDSDISAALIESIFFPKTPLHDGAMIINGTKILASGCFLPLSQETNLPKELGTRHRAGIGITETINVTALIVSEETGIISIAQGGKIKRYADSEMLRQTLKEYYWQEFLPHK